MSTRNGADPVPRWVARTAWLAFVASVAFLIVALLAACAGVQVPRCEEITFHEIIVDGQRFYVADLTNIAKMVERMKKLEAGECRNAPAAKFNPDPRPTRGATT